MCFTLGWQFASLAGLSSFGSLVFAIAVLWTSPSGSFATLLLCAIVTAGLFTAQGALLATPATLAIAVPVCAGYLLLLLTSHSVLQLEKTQRLHYIAEWTLGAQQRLLRLENGFFNNLLRSVLPEPVIHQLYAKQFEIVQEFKSVTVMFVEVSRCGCDGAKGPGGVMCV